MKRLTYLHLIGQLAESAPMRTRALLALLLAALAGGIDHTPALGAFTLSISEIWPGNTSTTNLSADWFEITNSGDTAWVAATDGDLWYDDSSPNAANAVPLAGVSTIPAGGSAVYVIGSATDALNWTTLWSSTHPDPMALFQVGTATGGAGLGQGGDAVNIWVTSTTPAGAPNIGASFPNANSNGGRSYDVALGAFSVIGNANDAVATTKSIDFEAAVGSPGVSQPPAQFSIFKWEHVDPQDPSLGKRESTVLATGGYGLHAQPGLYAAFRNLANAFLAGADLTDASFNSAVLTRAALEQANFTGADLTGANLTGANLSDAILTNAIVRNAKFSSTHISLDQLYSTTSYEEHDLTGVHFVGNDLSGANFADQNLDSASFYAAKLIGADFTNADLSNAELVNADLSQANFANANFTNATLALANLSQANLRNANFAGANLTSTNLTGADLRGANIGGVTTYVYGLVCGRPSVGGCLYYSYGIVATQIGGGVNLAQLITTANYQAHDLSGIDLSSTNLAGANFAGFKLTNADFTNATLTGADLSGADARGATGLASVAAPNFIRPDGRIANGLTLGAGQSLDIRDYDGGLSGTIPITVDSQLTMSAGATLRMVFDADAWDSTISFAPGIPVALGGSLELALAAGVDPFSQVGRAFHVFDWTGVTHTGSFVIATPYVWDLTNLYTTGQITFLAASGSGGTTQLSPAIPEPNSFFLLAVGLAATWMTSRIRHDQVFATSFASTARILPILALLFVPCDRSLAAPPQIQLAKIGNPVWKPVDAQLFSAPANPFDQEFGQVYNTLLPYDTPLAENYVPHAPPYDTELSDSMIAGGYVSRSVFTPDAITLEPNGVYFAYLMVPDPGSTGSSRDFTLGPIIPNSLFPISTNVDVWLDGVLVDRTPGADAVIPVQPRDAFFQGTSHLEYVFAIWHPWDDDLTVGPLGSYELRLSIRDVGGSGWDIVAPFQVVPELPGDFNHDGAVDAADYVMWRKTDGSPDDYTAWQENFRPNLAGSGAGHATESVVPEPSTFALTMSVIGGALLLLIGKSRQPYHNPSIFDPEAANACGSDCSSMSRYNRPHGRSDPDPFADRIG
jgi:uncharacterized protein YjbI with pentapeptide repeats